jgi:LysM repeat protein
MKTEIKSSWLIDCMVVIICLSTAAVSLHLFRLDLFRTLEARDEEPAGIIIIRNNIVQRRYADRTVWDRLVVDSPVYSGDLIRAADFSDATVHVDENQIGLNENTLIRIQHDPEGRGPFQIELREGNVNLVTGTAGSGLTLNLMGRQVQATPGTVLNAEMGEEGLIVQVSEGNATFIEEGQSRELSGGMMIAQDAKGAERAVPAAVVMYPRPNARYINHLADPLIINFSWMSMNINSDEPLRLEIASDSNFTKNTGVVEDFGNQGYAAFGAGTWHWRLSQGNVVLSKGQLTVADASGPQLLSPVVDSVFRYQQELPQLRFQWSEKPGASHYRIEIAESPDFNNPQLSRQVSSASFIQSAPGPGTWYWRVEPVFPSVYAGNTVFSPAASFSVEQTSDPNAPALELPDPALAVRPPVQVTQTAQTTQTVWSAQALPPVQTAQTVQATPPVQTTQTPQTVQATPPVQTTQTPQPTQTIPPVQTAQTGTRAIATGQNYTVQRGDVLHDIARRAYGNAALWTKIVEANDIPNPDLIEINDVLFIPH